MFVQSAWSRKTVPVLTYYMLLQSNPAGGDEGQTDVAHLRDPQLMQAYWDDVRLLFQRVRGTKPVVIHIEPDLWGYLEQQNASALASSFVAALELARQGRIDIAQTEAFAPLMVRAA